MVRVYVSSTYQDLRDCRAKVRLALQQLGLDDVAMETYVAGPQRPTDKCLEDVTNSDLYVGIIAWRYGYIPPGYDRSITELEYRTAVETKKDRLVFMLNENADWPRSLVERGAGAQRIDTLREELARDNLCSFFDDCQDLARLVATSVAKWLQEKNHTQLAGRGNLTTELLTGYYRRLQQQYERLDLDALTPPQQEEYLRIQLRQVFVEPSVRPDPPPLELPKELWHRLRSQGQLDERDLPTGFSLEDLRRAREAYQAGQATQVLDILTDSNNQRLVLLGDPGSGKSTLARYLTLALAVGGVLEERLARVSDYLPLLIELRSYAGLRAEGRCDSFLGFLDHLARTQLLGIERDALERYLRQGGRAFFILDGLDELFDTRQREEVAREIAGLAEAYPQVRILVTSRIIGYRRATLTDANFAHYTLQDLSHEQIGQFLERWYTLALHDRPEDAQQRRHRLLSAIAASQSIRELAGNPLLLTILAIIGKHQELPRERWKVYQHAVTVLIEHWDVKRYLQDQQIDADFITADDKQELLRRIAYRMQVGRGGLAGNYLPAEELQVEFEQYLVQRYQQGRAEAARIARVMISQFRERNFILSRYGADLYGFVHRAFLEYLSADWFRSRFERTREVSVEQLKQGVFDQHWKDESWQEVLRLIVGMLDVRFADQLITHIVDLDSSWRGDSEYTIDVPRNLLLAVQCMGEVRNVQTITESAENVLRGIIHYFETLSDGYVSELEDFFPEDFLPAVSAIGPAWPRREVFIEWFMESESAISDYFYDAIILIAAALGAGSPDLLSKVQGFTSHAKPWIHEAAIQAVAEGWRDDPATLKWLRDLVAQGEDRAAGFAVAVIARGWRTDPGTLTWLRDQLSSTNGRVRQAAVRAIAEGWREDQATLEWLHQLVLTDDHADVRQAAVRAIPRGWRDQATLEWLRAQVNQNQPSDVRQTVIEVIAQTWGYDLATQAWLRDQASQSPYPDVRQAAAQTRTIADRYGGSPSAEA